MLVVKTKLKPSEIDGIGLFADEDIPTGMIIWKNNPELSFIKFSEEEWKRRERELSEESFAQIKKYTYKYKKDKNYYIDLDCTRFINHSKNPNIEEDENRNDVAIKDIKKDEEFLIDYTSFYDEDYLKDEKYL